MTTPNHIAPLAVEIATAISLLEDDRHRVRTAVSEFEARFGSSYVDAWLLHVEGCPTSREAARGHGAAAQVATRLLQSRPVAARLELFALPWFRSQDREEAFVYDEAGFAKAAAADLERRLDRLARLEVSGQIGPPFLVSEAFVAYQPVADQLGGSWGKYVAYAFRVAAQVDPDTFHESWFDIVLQLDGVGLSLAIRDMIGRKAAKQLTPS